MASDFATTGTDTIVQTNGNDTLDITNGNQIQGDDFFDGGDGTDTIRADVVSGGTLGLFGVTTDASHGFHNYEAITFTNTSGALQVGLLASQFGTGLISDSLALTGVKGTSQFLTVINASNFSAASWTFTDWEDSSDAVSIFGTTGDDTLTGSSQQDAIMGDSGDDVIDGGPGLDQALYEGEFSTFTIQRIDNGTTSWIVSDTNPGADGDEGTDTLTNITHLRFEFSQLGSLVATSELIGALTDGDATENAVGEGASTGAVVGITASANDINDSVSYSLTDNAGGRFEIDDGSGIVTVDNASLIDFESAASHDIVVRATSDDGSFTEQQFTIDVVSNIIEGTPGNDDLSGTDDADTIVGLAGNDALNGLAGDDTLIGGLGKDVLTGGADADTFDFNSKKDSKTHKKAKKADLITDFSQSDGDLIDLFDIDAKKGGGNQKFKWIGKKDFHEKKGELHYFKQKSVLVVEGDINGDGKADFQIKVDGVNKLAADDFIL